MLILTKFARFCMVWIAWMDLELGIWGGDVPSNMLFDFEAVFQMKTNRCFANIFIPTNKHICSE